MKNNLMILADTRQQKDSHITNYFDDNNILWQRATLQTGDYMAVKVQNDIIFKDVRTIIDTKKDILEIANNLCHALEHERIKREIAKAHELGCDKFIFLIADPKISSIEQLSEWSSTKTRVKGETLLKVAKTMSERYDCEFIFCKKLEMGKKIVELLK